MSRKTPIRGQAWSNNVWVTIVIGNITKAIKPEIYHGRQFKKNALCAFVFVRVRTIVSLVVCVLEVLFLGQNMGLARAETRTLIVAPNEGSG